MSALLVAITVVMVTSIGGEPCAGEASAGEASCSLAEKASTQLLQVQLELKSSEKVEKDVSAAEDELVEKDVSAAEDELVDEEDEEVEKDVSAAGGGIEGFAQQQGNASLARSLLSKRTTGGCPGCVCVWNSVAMCGGKYVTDGAVCGWDTVKSAAICGTSAFKACKYGRRRRWSGLKCTWSDVAKSCKTAKSCQIANECNIADSWSNCIGTLKSSLGDGKKFMDLVTDTGCGNAEACLNKLAKIGEQAGKAMVDFADEVIGDTLTDLANDIHSSAISFTKTVVEEAPSLVNDATSAVSSLASTVQDYFDGALPTFEKFSIGDVCTASGEGFWSMVPTDCGAFTEMGKIFTDITNAAGHFTKTGNKFGTCVSKTGLLDFPTPFLELQIQSFCLPQFLITPFEYIIGAMLYTGDAAQSIATDIGQVTGLLTNFLSNKLGMSMLQLGLNQDSSSDAKDKGSKVASLASLARGDCGVKNNWGLQLSVSTVMAAVSPAGALAGHSKLTFEFGIGLLVGCKDGQPLLPNLVTFVGAGMGFTVMPGASASPSPKVSLAFSDTYPSFDIGGRVGIAPILGILPKVDLKAVFGVPLNLKIPIELMVNLETNAATGFTIAVQPGVAVTELLEEDGARIRAAAEKASELAAARGENIILAGVAAATRGLASSEALKSLLGSGERPELKEAVSHITQTKNLDLKGKTSKLVSGFKEQALPIDLTVAAGIKFNFCITPNTHCFGYDESEVRTVAADAIDPWTTNCNVWGGDVVCHSSGEVCDISGASCGLSVCEAECEAAAAAAR